MNLVPCNIFVGRAGLVALFLVPLLTACAPEPGSLPKGFAEIPDPEPVVEGVQPAKRWLSKTEVTVAQFCAFLNDLNEEEKRLVAHHPQVTRRQHRHVPRHGEARKPVAHVNLADAEAYCAWLGRRLGRPARLPTVAEWTHAAKAGQRHAAYPWGWDSPKGRAHFAAAAPSAVARYPANAAGFHDLAGNVFEWCRPDSDPEANANRCAAMGGSWAETDPALLRVDRPTTFPCDYRDADVGFRMLVEAAP